jgi:hypothetical protein
LIPPIAAAFQKGIPVIVLDRWVLGDHYTCFIEAENKRIAKLPKSYHREWNDIRGSGQVQTVYRWVNLLMVVKMPKKAACGIIYMTHQNQPSPSLLHSIMMRPMQLLHLPAMRLPLPPDTILLPPPTPFP